MNKIKLLTFAIVGLLMLNIGMIGFFVFGNKNHKRRMPKEIIIEKLHFDQQQISIYETKIKIHRKLINSLNVDISNNKNELYQMLNDEKIDTIRKDSLINVIANQQNQIENINFNHFLDIKKICKKDQINNFEKLTIELTEIFSKKHKPKND